MYMYIKLTISITSVMIDSTRVRVAIKGTGRRSFILHKLYKLTIEYY